MGSTVFVVDSSPAVHRMVEQLSSSKGYKVIGFHDGPSALDAARLSSPALIIADFHLENMTFSGFCNAISRQDNLAETLIVSIVDSSDRLDEDKLRSLGVRAVLKKPFQSEQLLCTIEGILRTPAEKQGNGKPAKTRTWPPVSTGTNDEDDESLQDASADDVTQYETEKEHRPMPPSPAHAASTSTSAPASVKSVGEEMLKGLFDHLLQSVTLQADRKLTDLLPAAIAKEVAGHVNSTVRSAVQDEVAKQLTEALAPDRLRAKMLEIVQEEVSRQSSSYLGGIENTVRQTLSDQVPRLVEQAAEKRLNDLADTGVKKHLPEALETHLEMINQLVKQEVEQAAANCARQAADDIVHEMAKDPIQQAVQRIVPDVAETQIRAEIKRLSSPD